MGATISASDETNAFETERVSKTDQVMHEPLRPQRQHCRALGSRKSCLNGACCHLGQLADLGIMTDPENSDIVTALGPKSCGMPLPLRRLPLPLRSRRAEPTDIAAGLQKKSAGLPFLKPEVPAVALCSREIAGLCVDSYEGQASPGGSRHGRGVCLFGDGSSYHGEWQRDEQHGLGCSLSSHGGIYDERTPLRAQHHGCHHYGQYASGRRHGYGIAMFQGGDRYEGDFDTGQISGHGTQFFANGDVYHGQFVGGLFHGRGSFFRLFGECYIGTFVDGQRQTIGGICFQDNGDVDIDLMNDESVGWSGNRERLWHSAGVPKMTSGDLEEVADACSRLGGPSREHLIEAFAGPPERPVPNEDVFHADEEGESLFIHGLLLVTRHHTSESV